MTCSAGGRSPLGFDLTIIGSHDDAYRWLEAYNRQNVMVLKGYYSIVFKGRHQNSQQWDGKILQGNIDSLFVKLLRNVKKKPAFKLFVRGMGFLCYVWTEGPVLNRCNGHQLNLLDGSVSLSVFDVSHNAVTNVRYIISVTFSVPE